MKQYFVYILTNIRNIVLYVGITNNLIRRVYEHQYKLVKGFTQKYNITKLVYYETFEDSLIAIAREKTIKNLLRSKKEQLINSMNPEWRDLYQKILSG